MEATISIYESSFTFPADVPSLVSILLCFAISNNRREGFIQIRQLFKLIMIDISK